MKIYFSRSKTIAILFLVSSYSEARFNERDSNFVDQEERNNTEEWNDKNSYRYPIIWDQLYEQSDFAYRISAGSLNASRFLIFETIKFKPPKLGAFSLSYLQSRHEDLVEQTSDSELRLSLNTPNGLQFSLLGDTTTFKEYGDLGLAINYSIENGPMAEIYYWEVDCYYRSKKSEESASRTLNTKTYGLKSIQKATLNQFGWNFNFEYDSPLIWASPSRGISYEYNRQHLDMRLDVPNIGLANGFISLLSDKKMESKRTLSLPTNEKKMRRINEVIEIGVVNERPSSSVATVSFQNIQRTASYFEQQENFQTEWSESLSPESIRRHEHALIASYYFHFTSKIALQHGIYLNDVSLKEDTRIWKRLEAKYQFLIDFQLDKNTRGVLNSTWDLDQITRDYPYSKNAPFRPWGGGDLQFLIKL